MEWTTAASFTARLGIAAYKNRSFIQAWWKKAQAYLDAGSTNVLITGRPNVGKSVLVGQMLGDARDLYYELPKESRSIEVEAITLGEWTKLVRTLPGQSSLVRTQGVNQSFDENSKLEGLIHVVDFGYTIPRDPVITQSLIEENKIDTIDKLRKYNLANETDEIKELLVSIERSLAKQKTPKWLVIAVNKVDLFKGNLMEALRFYHPEGNSDFSRALSDVQKRIGTQSLPIYVVATCAYEDDFKWNGEEIKSSLTKQEHRTIVREFMDAIAAISGDGS